MILLCSKMLIMTSLFELWEDNSVVCSAMLPSVWGIFGSVVKKEILNIKERLDVECMFPLVNMLKSPTAHSLLLL